MQKTGSVLALTALLALAGCETMAPANTSVGTAYPQSSYGAYTGYGVVQSIELVQQGSSGVGAGAVVGGIVGGILGNQVGGGRGNTAATVLGAAGGAYAGHELEKRNQPQANAYKFNIRMQDGSYQSVMQPTIDDIRVGDRVRIDNGVARRY
ncbi:MAG: glycine zipper 2TM domain-containing protein [Gammaproteobacteria bacterium]|nr:glycine zipper 2TM domain-containing protein [Rhodoferax sp.]MBU3900730.1 glycine zipper 2TM domain-containing protein [Gammaproteobacteria bacterium]MBU3997192.1 glycine zipper 2TM domain-containing protein [Gammaproteobacteria bacterium]MBU4079481.1 glycine zipper 2TM domain-containing protein [Gammaproteobacteria bacterium]MBU4114811.1 glycine zipper 2TM domain-containing protein [Gammaproteobacteria bacterium]